MKKWKRINVGAKAKKKKISKTENVQIWYVIGIDEKYV